MTSKLTRAQLHERARENVKSLKLASRQTAFESAREEILADLQLAELALAAMDSEPVAWQYRVSAGPATGWSLWHDGKGEQYENSYKVERRPLYFHAQPALVQPSMFIDGDISSEDADKLAKVIREFNEEDERPLAKMARIIRENPHPTNECDMPKGQPAPVSLTEAQVAALEEEEKSCHDGIRKCIASLRYHHKRAEAHSTGYKGSTLEDDTLKSINFLKRNIIAAMFRAEPVTTANKLGNSPVQSDCCPAQNSVSPEQNKGWIPVSERMPESNGVYFGWDGKRVLEVNCFFGGFSANQFIHGEITHWMPLPAAPQEVNHG